jgi:hypothetical protein
VSSVDPWWFRIRIPYSDDDERPSGLAGTAMADPSSCCVSMRLAAAADELIKHHQATIAARPLQ